MRQLIEAAGFSARLDPLLGFDHGTFAPLVVIYLQADIPVLELTIRRDRRNRRRIIFCP